MHALADETSIHCAKKGSPMSHVIQAKCPHCSNVLRIPADWLDKAMRCKFCKNTFQAKAKDPAPANGYAKVPVAKPANPIPVAKPAGAVQASAPVAVASRPASGERFDFPDNDPSLPPSVAKPRKKGSGT